MTTPTISITVTIHDQPITLTLEEARQLRDLLNQVVPEEKKELRPAFLPHVRPHVPAPWEPPVGVLYPPNRFFLTYRDAVTREPLMHYSVTAESPSTSKLDIAC